MILALAFCAFSLCTAAETTAVSCLGPENDFYPMVFTAAGDAFFGDAFFLPDLMQAMAENDIELVSLHDRPEMAVLGSYVYLIECADAGYDGFELRYYGAFPVK